MASPAAGLTFGAGGGAACAEEPEAAVVEKRRRLPDASPSSDIRADQFSLGVLALAVFTGSTKVSPGEIRQDITRDKTKAMLEVVQGLSFIITKKLLIIHHKDLEMLISLLYD